MGEADRTEPDRMEFRVYYRQLPVWARTAITISVGLGVVFLVVGVLLDWTDFWKDKGFLKNVSTSFVAALFGIPLAILGIGWFSYNQSTRVRTREVERLTINLWSDFANAVVAYTSPAVTGSLATTAVEAYEEYSAIFTIEGEVPTRMVHIGGYPRMELDCTPEVKASALESIAAAIDTTRRKISMTLAALESGHHNNREWMNLRSKWGLLSTDVRMQRAGEDLDWMDPEYDKTLTVLLDGSSYPFSGFMYELTNRLLPNINQLEDLAQAGDLRKIVEVLRSGAVGGFQLSEYERDRLSGLGRMIELRDTVIVVNESGWPGKDELTRLARERGMDMKKAAWIAGVVVTAVGVFAAGFGTGYAVKGGGVEPTATVASAGDAVISAPGPTALPKPATNSRGSIEKKFGDPAGLGCKSLPCDVEFVISAPIAPTECRNNYPVENGRLIALPVSVETKLGADLTVFGGMWNPNNWSAVKSTGVTQPQVTSAAAYGCAESDKSIPDTMSPASKYEGFIVLDIPTDATALQFIPHVSDGGWEFALK